MSGTRPSLDLLHTLVKEDENRSHSPHGDRGGGGSDSDGSVDKRNRRNTSDSDESFYGSNTNHRKGDRSDQDSSSSSDKPTETSTNEDYSESKKSSEKSEEDNSKLDKNGIVDSDSFSEKELEKEKDPLNKQNDKKKAKVFKKKRITKQLKSPVKNVPKFPGDKKVDVPKDFSSSRNRRGSLSSDSCDEKLPEDTDSGQKIKNNKKRLNSSKRKKLLSRSEMSRPKTYLNADICLEDNLYQKYKELDTILTGHFVEKTSNLTRSHIHQMEQMRQQYSVVSHGMSPRGVLIPRSLPSHIRNHEKVQLVCGEESECSNLTDRSEDLAFQTICSIMTADNARKQKKIRTDIRADANSEKLERKNEKKKANTKLQRETSKTDKLSFKSHDARGLTPLDSHLKNNPDARIKQWLIRKNLLYRQEKAKKRAKVREEKQERLAKANEKAMKTEESKKVVQKWIRDKKREPFQRPHDENKNRERKELKVSIIRPGIDLINLPFEHEEKSPVSEKETSQVESPTEIRERWQQQAKDRQNRKPTEPEKQAKPPVKTQVVQSPARTQTPQPPKSKFIYKRPVAGRIKLRAQTKESPAKEEVKEKTEKDMRRSYDDWLVEKRKEEQERKQNSLQQKEMRHSESDLSKLIPEMARKRIAKKAADKKRVDTGMHSGNMAGGKGESGEELVGKKDETSADEDKESDSKNKTTYRLPVEVSQDVKLNDKSLTSPKPKPSAQSPRKAIPAKIHAQNVETVMNNKFETNPFKLPFPPELGVPKYVDDKQKLIFSSHMFDDLDVDKRPEPQGCDANHPPVCNTQAPPAKKTDTAAPLDDSSCVKSPPSDKTFAEKDAVSSTEKQNDSHGHDVETNDKEAADVNRFDIGHEKHKSGKTSANMGKRVSFSEETTVFEASDSPGSDTSSPREDVQFVEDMKSEDFGRSDSVDIPSGTFLTSLDADN